MAIAITYRHCSQIILHTVPETRKRKSRGQNALLTFYTWGHTKGEPDRRRRKTVRFQTDPSTPQSLSRFGTTWLAITIDVINM